MRHQGSSQGRVAAGAPCWTLSEHGQRLNLNDEGPDPISYPDPSDVQRAQLPAALNCSTTSALMRPRALTSIPCPLAQARTAAGSYPAKEGLPVTARRPPPGAFRAALTYRE